MPGSDGQAMSGSDALSLHTIPDTADDYAQQEDEHATLGQPPQSNDGCSRQNDSHTERITENEPHTRTNLNDSRSYRDDPDADSDEDLEALPPYRDDPDAAPPADDENVEAQLATTSERRTWLQLPRLPKLGRFSRANISSLNLGQFSKTLRKIPCCILLYCVVAILVLSLVTVIGVRLLDSSAREKAWKASGSGNYNLKLNRLYPKLEDGASQRCKDAWEKYAGNLYCQKEILEAAWDKSDPEDVRRTNLDPWAYSDDICFKGCKSSILDLRNPFLNECNQRTDRFDIEGYGSDGKRYFDTSEIPEGPRGVAKQLIDRYDRLCTSIGWTEWGTCAAHIWMRFDGSVVDGSDSSNMNGIDVFMNATNESRVVEGGLKSGAVKIIEGEKKYHQQVPDRRMGPHRGESECGPCVLDWLQRKMMSFEFGAIIDPDSGKPMGLSDFNDRMTAAVERCEWPQAEAIIEQAHTQWQNYGWWCDGEPCKEETELSDSVRTLLYGLQIDDWPLPELRKVSGWKNAPKDALLTLHDDLLSLPCSIWQNPVEAQYAIIPSSYLVNHICSDRCRNAVDRVQRKHGDLFVKHGRNSSPLAMFRVWDTAVSQLDQLCFPVNNSVVLGETIFGAPGFAAVGHAEQVFSESKMHKNVIIESFSKAVDKLERKLSAGILQPPSEKESHMRARMLTESVCNPVSGRLLLGKNPNYKDRVDEFFEDLEIDWNEYVKVVKKWFLTCYDLGGSSTPIPQWKWREIWDKIGLNRKRNT